MTADFRLLMENSADIICRCSMHFEFSYVSPSSRKVLGWSPEEMMEIGLTRLVFAEDIPLLVAARNGTHQVDGKNTSVTLRMSRKDGELVWIEINPTKLLDEVTGESLRESVLVMRDVTKTKLLEEKLAAMAMTDALTGLANRRAFDDALDREWRLTLRAGTQMSLLLMDIDYFKQFNDVYGHQVGDDCLRAVASAAAGAVRTTDVVARYGGEEIGIILPMTDMQGAADTAEKVRLAVMALRLTHEINHEHGGQLTASIGAATALARHGGTMRMPESLLLSADNALYRAKDHGRNRVETALLIAPQDL